MVKWRLAVIKTESGGQISVNYSGPDCSKTDLPTADDTNTRRCFPQYWTREGATTPTKTYFHKYVVTSVVADDLTGGSTDQVTSYDYLGTPAWHYDDLEITPTKYRAYSDWRGYARVRVRIGDGQTPNTATETAYLRGMGGSVTDRLGSQSDADYYNGFVRESATYLGGTATSHGALVAQTFTAPVVAATTATDGTDSSRIIRPGTVRTYTRDSRCRRWHRAGHAVGDRLRQRRFRHPGRRRGRHRHHRRRPVHPHHLRAQHDCWHLRHGRAHRGRGEGLRQPRSAGPPTSSATSAPTSTARRRSVPRRARVTSPPASASRPTAVGSRPTRRRRRRRTTCTAGPPASPTPQARPPRRRTPRRLGGR